MVSRAALCRDAEAARQARQWNHANVVGIAMGATDQDTVRQILEAWFTTPYGSGDTGLGIDQIRAYEYDLDMIGKAITV